MTSGHPGDARLGHLGGRGSALARVLSWHGASGAARSGPAVQKRSRRVLRRNDFDTGGERKNDFDTGGERKRDFDTGALRKMGHDADAQLLPGEKGPT